MGNSRAKSGLTADRQLYEAVMEPSNTYSIGAVLFESAIRDGRGHSEYHVAVVNDNAFTLTVIHSWRPAGVWTRDQAVVSQLDPESGMHVAEIIAPIQKRYLKVRVDMPAPGAGAHFEVGWYFQPRASGPVVTSEGGEIVTIGGNQQVQTIETTAALAAGATFNGAEHDCLNFESFGISVYAERGAADTALTITVQQRAAQAGAGSTWRPLDTITLNLIGVGDTDRADRVYSVTRRFVRLVLTNGAGAITTIEAISLRKPIA